jgi:hypothetical protein
MTTKKVFSHLNLTTGSILTISGTITGANLSINSITAGNLSIPGTLTVTNITVNNLLQSTGTLIATGSQHTIGTLNITNGTLNFPNVLQNKRIVVWDVLGNQHQYYGLGINGSTFRFNIDSAGSFYRFYRGDSSSGSTEIFNISGSGSIWGAGGATFNGGATFMSGKTSVLGIEDQGSFVRLAFNELRMWEHGHGDMFIVNGGAVSVSNLSCGGYIGNQDGAAFYSGYGGFHAGYNWGSGAYWNAANSVTRDNFICRWGGYTGGSDIRMKEDIEIYSDGLNFIKQLQPKSFRYKPPQGVENIGAKKIGFIVQDIQVFEPDFYGISHNTTDDMYYLEMTQFIGPLVNSVKEVDQTLEQALARIEQLESENEQLKSFLRSKFPGEI